MKRDEIYKKMGFWNGFYLVIGVIGLLFSIYNIVDTFITKNTEKKLEKFGLDPAEFGTTTFDKVILVIVTIISIYCVVMAFKNRGKIIEKLKVDVLPYILTLLLAAFNFVRGIIQQTNTKQMPELNNEVNKAIEGVDQNALMAGVAIGIVFVVIALILELLPSIRMLMLNSKLNKLPVEEESFNE